MVRRPPEIRQRVILYAGPGAGSNAAEPQARAQELLRIDRFAVDAGLIVQMRAGRTACRANLADDLADADLLADFDVDLRQMAIAGGEAVAVVDLDHIAI